MEKCEKKRREVGGFDEINCAPENSCLRVKYRHYKKKEIRWRFIHLLIG
jgi:hypothetical protein